MFIQITFWSENQQTNLTAHCSPGEQQRENNVGSRFVLELLVEVDLELRLFCQLLLSKVNNEPSSSTFKSTWMTGRSVWTHRTTNTRVKILDHLVFTANFMFSYWFQGETRVCYGSAAVVRRHRRVKIKPAPPSGPDVCLKRTLSWISFISQLKKYPEQRSKLASRHISVRLFAHADTSVLMWRAVRVSWRCVYLSVRLDWRLHGTVLRTQVPVPGSTFSTMTKGCSSRVATVRWRSSDTCSRKLPYRGQTG